MQRRQNIPVVLTIAGSDSGGGAGVQADLKTFAALNVFGASAITCLTAQNPREITAVWPVDPGMIIRQVEAVSAYFTISAVKIGMLFNRQAVLAVAGELKRAKFPVVVVDPVCRATSGRRLVERSAFHALCSKLLPLATVITPNIPEAELLLKRRIGDHADQRAAALQLSKQFKTDCVVKGGHLRERDAIDVLCHAGRLHSFNSPRLQAPGLHGSGCVFSAALAAFLARGMKMQPAVGRAKKHVFQLIQAMNKHRLYSWTGSA